MALRPAEGVEPIKGYRLVQRLGVGGYGEVWKATAPGELTKAIKIIFGDANDTRADQERKALKRIKDVRHPFLLSLERVEEVDNQVFIVMELAEASLMERFKDCQEAGLPGIPRDELLQYIRDAADALDYMNENYGLQHLDIKPQNLLLVGRRIKIADFGLVKDLCGTSVTATGGVTPIYAPPEAFDGRVSRFSDQYSLAIVYQEMLTGQRPFPGQTTLQLAAQHLTSPPLLDPLPPADRPVIARALSKTADQRYGTCREMVDALIAAGRPVVIAQVTPVSTPSPDSPGRANGTPSAPTAAASVCPEDEQLLSLDTMISPEKPAPIARTPPVETTPYEPNMLISPVAAPSDVLLRPTLFIGIGGLAGLTLRRLRQRLHGRFGNLSRVPIHKLLLLDTDRDSFRVALTGRPGEVLNHDETLYLPLHRPEHYRSQSRDLLRWLDRRWLYGIPRSLRTEGVRSLGRLALVDNACEVLDRLRETLAQMTSSEARMATKAGTGLGLRDETPRIFLVASIAGGTGGGMVLDLAYSVRQILGELGLPDDGLCGLLIHATGANPAQADLARINAYATLRELNHLGRPDVPYAGDPRHGLASFEARHVPFSDCYLVHLGDQIDERQLDGATDKLAEYLYLDAVTPAGGFFDQYRRMTHTAPRKVAGAMLRTFGLDRLVFPRHALVEAAAHGLCSKLIRQWQTERNQADERIKEEFTGRIQTLGLDAQAVTDRLYEAASSAWGDDPETHCRKLLAEWLDNTPVPAPDRSPSPLAQRVLEEIDALLDIGRDRDEAADAETSPLQKTLSGRAEELGAKLSRGVMEWLVELIETPERRLSGAESAAALIVQHVASLTDGARSLLSQYRAAHAEFRQRLESWEKELGAGRRGSGRRQGAGERGPQLQDYGWQRIKEVVTENAVIVFRFVSQRLNQFSGELALARQKLSHLADMFELPAEIAPAPSVPFRSNLLPGRVSTVPDAAKRFLDRLEPKIRARFAEIVQKEVLTPEGGLWRLLGGNVDLAEALKAQLHSRAGTIILEALEDTDAAQLFLQRHEEPARAREALSAHVRAAVPDLLGQKGPQHLLVVLPASPAGKTLQEMVTQLSESVPMTAVRSDGDVIFAYEVTQISLQRIAAALIGTEASHREIAHQVRTRVDVAWSPMGKE
jgi:serine/threonine protein kinase